MEGKRTNTCNTHILVKTITTTTKILKDNPEVKKNGYIQYTL